MEIDFKACPPGAAVTAYRLTLHLHDAIRPEDCTYEPAGKNLLVILVKAKSGVMWPSLEAEPAAVEGKGEGTTAKRSGSAASTSSSNNNNKRTTPSAVPTFRNQVMFELD